MTTTAVGIDLGTTYSCVGVCYNSDNVEILTNDQGHRTTPSYVAFTEAERLVGEAAKNQCAMNPENTVFDAKRMIGRKFSDKVVQDDMKLWPFKVVKGDDEKPRIQVTYKNELKQFRPEEISSMVLAKMKEYAETRLGNKVTDAVITVPAYFNDAQRQSTKDAAVIAGLNVLRIINEPTAAAIAYGLNKKGERNVLIFDYGGGTLDVSILTIDDQIFEVLSTCGDTHLGGEDIDNALVKFCVDEFKRTSKIDVSGDNRALRRLRTACESAKRTLSSTNQTMVHVDALSGSADCMITLTRAKLESLCDSMFKKCMEPVEKALTDSGLSKDKIDEIVLVGGSSRIPKVQELLSKYFGGKKLCNSINPDEAVAYGAAVFAYQLSGAEDASKNIVLMDVAPLTLGVEERGMNMVPLIKRGTKVPCKNTQTFSTGSHNQPACEIKVYEGERKFTKDNNLLGRFMLEGLPPLPAGVPQIEITYEVDENGILNVSAVEKSSGKSNKITITNEKGRLSKDDVDRMIAEAEKFKEEDERLYAIVQAKNQLESYILQWNSTLNEDKFKEKLSEDDMSTLKTALDDASKWLDDHQMSDSKDCYEDKLKELENVVTPIAKKTMGGEGGMPGMAGMPGMEGMTPEMMQKMMAQMQGGAGQSNGPKVEEVD